MWYGKAATRRLTPKIHLTRHTKRPSENLPSSFSDGLSARCEV
ncbi:hypothetical protein [Neisseria elongata]|nr:hypothetical protein [Neisseria elongata]